MTNIKTNIFYLHLNIWFLLYFVLNIKLLCLVHVFNIKY